FTRNVAAECGQYGFRYEATPGSALKLNFHVRQPDGTRKELDVRTLPFVRFEDNEVHSTTGLYGVNLGEGVNRVGPDTHHPFVVKNLKIWDTHYGFRPQVPNLLVENLTIHKVGYGVYHPNYENHAYRNVLISQTHTEPFNRGHDDLSVQYGILTVDGLTFDGCRSGGMPLIQISDDNPTGRAETHMRNVRTLNWADTSRAKALANLGGGPRPQPKTEKGVPIYFHDWYGPGRHAQAGAGERVGGGAAPRRGGPGPGPPRGSRRRRRWWGRCGNRPGGCAPGRQADGAASPGGLPARRSPAPNGVTHVPHPPRR